EHDLAHMLCLCLSSSWFISMSLEHSPVRQQRGPRHPRLSEQQKKEKRLARQAVIDRAQARGTVYVIPFLEWCATIGVSKPVGEKLAKAKKVKITQVSERLIGVRSDHHQEFLDSCLRDGS